MNERYCPRCSALFDMAQRPGEPVWVVLPPHDPDCPKIAYLRPSPLPPRAH